MRDANAYLWWLPDQFGPYFWLLLAPIGAYGMFYMYRLAAPSTLLGRFIRLFLSLGFMGLVFTPAVSGIAPFAFYFIALGAALTVKQIHMQCVANGHIKKSTAPTFVERLVDKIHEPNGVIR